MLTKFLSFLGLIVLCSAGAKHEYYVSITQAEQNVKTKVIEVSIKVFTDDLERCYNINTQQVIMLNDLKQRKLAEEFLENYLAEHFVFISGKNVIDQTFVGFEAGPDETIIYLEMQPPTRTFSVKHTVLFDAFKDQINIMHLTANGRQQSFYFSMNKPLLEITL